MAILPYYQSVVKRIKKIRLKKKHLKVFGKNFFWFTLGSILGLFFFISFLYIIYQKTHAEKVYEGVLVNGIDFGGRNPGEIQDYFADRNNILRKTKITLYSNQTVATISASQIDFGYDDTLLADQAMTVGRSGTNALSNISLILQAYINTINLPPAYHYSEHKLNKILDPLKKQIDRQPVDPLFNFEDGKVVTLREGIDGKILDEAALKKDIIDNLKASEFTNADQPIIIPLPIRTLPAELAEDKANTLGIKEEVSVGTSVFYHSAEDRIFNLSLAASRLNGIIIKPGEIFSFVKAVGDISAFTGYKQAYVIQDGKTVLGDGGGVCQVSTTLFRAALNAGLPIVERHQHAYRVGYYEGDSDPGIDAAIYSPTVDLKFKNDTGYALLIQTYLDKAAQRLTFVLYGTKDNRVVTITKPVILSETPAPEPLYQDDPTAPKGTVKQIDFAAAGANIFFTRSVTKDGKILISDKFTSNYRPWQAIYLKGTKE